MRKTILITGASSGLGAGMAREFARLGRDLALCARRLPLLESLRDELSSAYPTLRIAIAAIDVTKHDEVFSGFQDFREKLGSLDRIIVNAGMGKGRGERGLDQALKVDGEIVALGAEIAPTLGEVREGIAANEGEAVDKGVAGE